MEGCLHWTDAGGAVDSVASKVSMVVDDEHGEHTYTLRLGLTPPVGASGRSPCTTCARVLPRRQRDRSVLDRGPHSVMVHGDAVDHDVAISCCRLGLCHCAGDPVRHIGHQRVVGDLWPGRPVAGNEDRDAIVMVTTPVISLFDGVAIGEDGSHLLHLMQKVSADFLLRRWSRLSARHSRRTRTTRGAA
jgi:hypothetical protein